MGEYLGLAFAHVLTVCDRADALRPLFAAGARQHHRAFPDPGSAPGTIVERLVQYRAVRYQLKAYAQALVRKGFATLARTNTGAARRSAPLGCLFTTRPAAPRG